jgi:hypothetical protein
MRQSLGKSIRFILWVAAFWLTLTLFILLSVSFILGPSHPAN